MQARRIGGSLIATVVLISAIAPLATDMYVPAFPQVASDLHASTSAVQLTLTTFFAGVALGQLAGGPVSDQRGRKPLLLAGTVLFTLASLACALAPNMGVMLAARFLEGLGGGWAMVISRAVIVDLAVSGTSLVRALGIIAGVSGMGPVVGPLLGGLILQFSDWRAPFWVLVGAGALMSVFAVLFLPESLPPERRHAGGFRTFGRAAAAVVSNRAYLGYVLVATATMAGVFAYVSTSAFILETINGLSPLVYSLDFAGNAAASAIVTLIAARLAGLVPTRRLILIGQVIGIAGGIGLLAGGLVGSPLLLVLVCFLALMLNLGLSFANSGALASAEVPDHPGTGSAVLGLFQWLAAGITAPLTGLGGNITVSAGIIATAALCLSLLGLLVLTSPRPHAHRGAQPRLT
jgi:DHA1 family bicyclomycin/chloramphenicol resistance-like MFS transporter